MAAFLDPQPTLSGMATRRFRSTTGLPTRVSGVNQDDGSRVGPFESDEAGVIEIAADYQEALVVLLSARGLEEVAEPAPTPKPPRKPKEE